MTIDKPRFTSDDEARDFIRSESPIPPLPEPPVPPVLSDDDIELPSSDEQGPGEVPEPSEAIGVAPGKAVRPPSVPGESTTLRP